MLTSEYSGSLRHPAPPTSPSSDVWRNRLRARGAGPNRSRLLEVHAHAGSVQPHHCKRGIVAVHCL